MAMDVGIEVDSDWSGVICLGMGGSGAGGRFLKSLADAEGGLPIVVWSDYGLPSWWGPDWLVLATSYSGDTEETLGGVREALESGGTVIGVSSGGQLAEMLEGSDDCILLSAISSAPNSQPVGLWGSCLRPARPRYQVCSNDSEPLPREPI
jgi:glucose/mannose-6-phosphate isomerase